VTDVSVVVVTYNSLPDVLTLLGSLREHTAGVSYDAIVVDNASRDGTGEAVAREHPSVRTIHRASNGGLARAINDGVRASSGELVAVLNPDVRLVDDALSTLAAYLRAHPDIGVVGPRLLNEDGTLQLSCRSFPGYATAFFSRYSLATRLVPGNPFSRRYLMSDYDHAEPRDVDWLSGAAMMFPRKLFDAIGGWDERFFLFNEDVDFCKRAHEAGWRVVYNPGASMYHRIGISRSAPARVIVERHRSMWRYYRKHMRGGRLRDALTTAGIAVRCAGALAVHGAGSLRRR
jgi:GT2 family glycosyltransferase